MMAGPGTFGMQYGGMGGMGGMGGLGGMGGPMPNPYLMMQQMGAYPPGAGSYPQGAAGFGFTPSPGVPTAFSPQAGSSQSSPFAQQGAQQQHGSSQQQQHGGPPQHMAR